MSNSKTDMQSCHLIASTTQSLNTLELMQEKINFILLSRENLKDGQSLQDKEPTKKPTMNNL